VATHVYGIDESGVRISSGPQRTKSEFFTL